MSDDRLASLVEERVQTGTGPGPAANAPSHLVQRGGRRVGVGALTEPPLGKSVHRAASRARRATQSPSAATIPAARSRTGALASSEVTGAGRPSGSRPHAVYLRIPGGGFVELLEYVGIERMPAESRPCDYGAGHLCLYVDDVAAIHRRMTEAGHRARSSDVVDIDAGPNAGSRSVYLLDPDGYAVELFQRRPGA